MHFEKRILATLISAILVLKISPLFAQEITWTRQALESYNEASARAALTLDSIEVKLGETAEVRITYTSDPTFGTSVIAGIICCQRALCQVVGAIIGADGERVTLRDTTGIDPTQQYVWIEASFKPDRRQSSQTREPARLSVRGVGVGQSNLVWQTVRLSFSAPFPTPPISLTANDGLVNVSGSTIVTERNEFVSTLALHQNYPNPFNPQTEIDFSIEKTGLVVLRIFNTLGEEVRTLVDGQYAAGYHRIHWDGKDNNGRPITSGVYLYQLQAGKFSHVRKMSLLR